MEINRTMIVKLINLTEQELGLRLSGYPPALDTVTVDIDFLPGYILSFFDIPFDEDHTDMFYEYEEYVQELVEGEINK